MLNQFVGLVFDGVAYGSLLFLIGVGLSITLGLMNFINLAHGAFAMAGGYVTVLATNRAGLPFLAALPLALLITAAAGAVFERLLFRRLYKASHMDQVLFTVGFVFSSMAVATWIFGAGQQPITMPGFLSGQVRILGVDLGAYRIFLIGVVAVIAVALQLVLSRTRFGAQVRAAVDNQDASAGLGINVGFVFSLTFAAGTGLAGLGGAMGVEVLGLDPSFPMKYMVYFLLVVVVGGAGSIRGPLYAALTLGFADVAGKYFVPELGSFVIYGLMIALLIAFPNGLSGRRA
jgi:branched-chain amino acid transport system permease protein